jgi:hypothetical protein
MKGIAAVALALLACASETGVLLVITTDEDAPRPDELVVMVGEPMGELDIFNDPGADRFAVDADRDLAADPIRYLIRPNEGKAIRVAAVGLGANVAPPLTAHYSDSLEFAPNVVLEIELRLAQRETESFEECGMCFRGLEDGFQISSHLDADCDLSRPADQDAVSCVADDAFTPPDCDDLDPKRNAKQIESCDGVDNDCDDLEDVRAACFDDEADSCLAGVRVCNGDGWGECATEGDPLGDASLCAALGDCSEAEDPIACFVDKHEGRISALDCEVDIAVGADLEGGGLCSSGPLMSIPTTCEEIITLAVEGPPAAAEAVLFGEQGISASPGTRQVCSLEPIDLELRANSGLTRGARFMFFERAGEIEPGALHVISLVPRYVDVCPADGDSVSCVSR